MPFETGREKTGGRRPNTPNRTTAQMREAMQNVFNDNLERLEQDLEAMTPLNRWSILTKLANYVLPTLSKNQNQNENTGEMKITVEYTNDKTEPNRNPT